MSNEEMGRFRPPQSVGGEVGIEADETFGSPRRFAMTWPVAVLAVTLVASGVASAADHFDAPEAAKIDKTADVAGLFAWTDAAAKHLNLVMTVHPFAGTEARFSNAVQYAFHINSGAGIGDTKVETIAHCEFGQANQIQCWVGDEYVSGDPTKTDGLLSASGKLRVFAGLRDDPFIFSFGGFAATVKAVTDAAASLEFDRAGCPQVPKEVSAQLVSTLQSDGNGKPAIGTFDGKRVLALVLQVDRTVVTPGGPVVGVWASTHKKSSGKE